MENQHVDLLERLMQCFAHRRGWLIHNSQSGWVEVSEDLYDILREVVDMLIENGVADRWRFPE